ncbi:MAG: hypothetical protein K2W96_10815 [Gemmataceae bacterium]|nr:hypothetical protein [Gemmataceae bacterium]
MRRLLPLLLFAPLAHAQKGPELGYVFPPGGKAGTTVEVRLGGYNWTPDMEHFSLDPRVRLQALGEPGPILIPPPPYWFGAKGRLGANPLPRETAARFTLPSDLPPGPVRWQAANANGATAAGVFIVGTGPEVVEDEARKGPQALASLPVTVSGRLLKIEEVDRYAFTAAKDGPVTCELSARRLGSKFHGVIEVRDARGKVVADVAGTSGADPSLVFMAKAKEAYTVSVHDIDFGGDRSYVYRLALHASPRIVGAIPAVGTRGQTREVEFILDDGSGKLASAKRAVAFPATGEAFDYRLAPDGPAYRYLLDDLPDAITGTLAEADARGVHSFAWKKGEVWAVSAEALRLGSPLDVALSIAGPDGKELAQNDDLPGTTDAGLDFTVPAEGTYRVTVSDNAGKAGTRAALYRLAVRKRGDGFALKLGAQHLSLPLGEKATLAVTALRHGECKGPIALTVKGLPPGVTVPPGLAIPAGASSFAITLAADAKAGTAAGLVTVEGTATVAGKPMTRTALAPTAYDLAPRGPDEGQVGAVLLAVTMKPKFGGRPVDADTGRKVHRGTTFPADILIHRKDGWNGEIVLKMAANQSYQVQGITGGDVVVPPGAAKAVYPCYMPEWLETTRTSRMGLIAVAKVADPKGKVRHLVGDVAGFVTMTMEGALLKLSAEDADLTVTAGKPFEVRLKAARLAKLTEAVSLSLREGPGSAAKAALVGKKEDAVVVVAPTPGTTGRHAFTFRAEAMQEGKYAVVSETTVWVDFVAAKGR